LVIILIRAFDDNGDGGKGDDGVLTPRLVLVR